MAILQYPKRKIDAKIEELITNNNNKEISAADVRSIIKDYVTQSTYGPVLIYAGKLKRKVVGSNATPPKDWYFNAKYFREQSETNPTSSNNPVQLSTVNVPNSVDGDFSYYFGNDEDGSGYLFIEYTVLSNVITKFSIVAAGGGLTVGSTFNLPVQNNTVVLTYNGVITSGGGSEFSHRFIMHPNGNVPTQGTNPFIRNHVKGNTLFVANGFSDTSGNNTIATFDNVANTNEFRLSEDQEAFIYIYRLTL